MRLCRELKIIVFVKLCANKVALEIENDFENGNSDRHNIDRCSQNSSNATSADGNFFWLLKVLCEEILKSSHINPKTRASK